MKALNHIVCTLIALAALMGCAKDRYAAEGPKAIRWNVAVQSPQTKAYTSGVTTAYSRSNSFGCFGIRYNFSGDPSDWTWNDWISTPAASCSWFINGEEVRFIGDFTETDPTKMMWSTLSDKYWPSDVHSRLHFISFSPYSSLHGKAEGNAVFTSPAEGLKITGYTVPADKANQLHSTGRDNIEIYNDDLMVSVDRPTAITGSYSTDYYTDYDCSYYYDTTNPMPNLYEFHGVPTLFQHVMARINFQFIQSEYVADEYQSQKISVLKVQLNNIYNKGTYTQNTNAWATDPSSGCSGVIYDNPIGNEDINQIPANPDPGAPEVLPTPLVSGYLAIPQTIAQNTQEIEVTYRITSKSKVSDGGYIYTEQITEKAYLYSAGKDWDINTDLTYTITLHATRNQPIQFTACCEKWKDGTGQTSFNDGQYFKLTPTD